MNDAPTREPWRQASVPSSSALLLLDSSSRVVAASAAASQQIGRAPGQLRGLLVSEVFRDGSMPTFPWIARLAESAEPPPPRLLDLEAVKADGSMVGFEGVLYAINVGHQPAGECVAGLKLRSHVGLQVKSQVLGAQRQVLDLVSSGATLRVTLRAVAEFAEHIMPGEVFCLLTPVDSTGRFEVGLCPTLPEEVAQLQSGHRVDEDWSPAIRSARMNTPLIANEFELEPSWAEFCGRVHRHGLMSTWVVPVRESRGEAIRAVLEFLLPVRRQPSRDETELMDELAEMVRLAIDLHRLSSDLSARATAQKAAEETAVRRGQVIDYLVDGTMDSIISIDREGCITVWNRQSETLFGWTADETRGKLLSDFIIPPELVQAHKDGFARFHQTGHGPLIGRRIEVTAIKKSGERFPVELSLSKIPGSEGIVTAFIRDISERRKSEEAIKASEGRLKLVVDASTDGFWDLRRDGVGSLVSDRCATMLGYAASDQPLVHPPDHPWVHPEDRSSVAKAWSDHLEQRTPRYESEHRRKHADGSWRWILERGQVVERDEHGVAQRMVGTQTDVQERRTLAASLNRAERMESLGRFADGFAKELVEILSVIRAQASLANVVPDLPPRIAESLAVIQLSVSRGKSMANSLLGMAPPGAADQPSAGDRVHVISVTQAIRSAMQLLRPTLPRTVEVLIEDRAAGRDLVRVDTTLFQQAIMHVVLHACESVASAGHVILRVREAPAPSHGILVECLDNGRPMSPEEIARIPDAFAPDGSLVHPSALGMAAVGRFAQAAGGTLSASVTHDGNCLSISLPLHTIGNVVTLPAVVLWEDHPLLKVMLGESLTASGHRVLSVATKTEVIKAIKQGGQSAVLVLNERDWSGSLAPSWPKTCTTLGWLPSIVVLTDGTEHPTVQDNVAFLSKPFVIEALLAAIRGKSPVPANSRGEGVS